MLIKKKRELFRAALLFMLCQNHPLMSYCSSCNDPVREGTDHAIELQLSTSNKKSTHTLRISSSTHGIIANCYNNGTCKDIVSDLYSTTLVIKSEWCLVTVKIHNVSRAGLKTDQRASFSAGFMENSQLDQRMSKCVPAIFSKPQNINCTLSELVSGLYVNCFSDQVFPRGKCFFSANFVLESNRLVITNTAYEKDNTTYFHVNCSLHLPGANLSVENKVVNVTLYPNVTENQSDIPLYGINSTVTFVIDLPSVGIPDCPTVITEGKSVKCVCKRLDKSVYGVSLEWYDKDTNALVSGEVLSFVANRIQPIYYCKSTNIFGWESKHVYYRPLIDGGNDMVKFIAASIAVATILTMLALAFKCLRGRFRWEFPITSLARRANGNLDIAQRSQKEIQDDGYLEIIERKSENVMDKLPGRYDCLNEYHLYETLDEPENRGKT
ncbi:unnamed protein product [Lymnaea stagnalis]|uniref:Ig-like domain-containing protein n=1 Tax=Lymnaea stagnalis TaxID=6523 RepID=A0AAV2HGJ8_LYMST